jgi:hypothetical protein
MASADPYPSVRNATSSAANDVDMVAQPRARGTWIFSAERRDARASRPPNLSGSRSTSCRCNASNTVPETMMPPT